MCILRAQLIVYSYQFFVPISFQLHFVFSVVQCKARLNFLQVKLKHQFLFKTCLLCSVFAFFFFFLVQKPVYYQRPLYYTKLQYFFHVCLINCFLNFTTISPILPGSRNKIKKNCCCASLILSISQKIAVQTNHFRILYVLCAPVRAFCMNERQTPASNKNQ